MDSQKKLFRSTKDKKLAGVCGGIADFLSVDSTIIRLLWIIGTFIWGIGLFAYIAGWFIIPKNPNEI